MVTESKVAWSGLDTLGSDEFWHRVIPDQAWDLFARVAKIREVTLSVCIPRTELVPTSIRLATLPTLEQLELGECRYVTDAAMSLGQEALSVDVLRPKTHHSPISFS